MALSNADVLQISVTTSLDSLGDTTGLDERSSFEHYNLALAEALAAIYPNATITAEQGLVEREEIDYPYESIEVDGYGSVPSPDMRFEERVRECIRDISGQIWSDWDSWAVTQEGECECVCGCAEPATGPDEGVAVCDECSVYFVDASGEVICSRMTSGERPDTDYCHDCHAAIEWGAIDTHGAYHGRCECEGREWTTTERGPSTWSLSFGDGDGDGDGDEDEDDEDKPDMYVYVEPDEDDEWETDTEEVAR